MIDIPEGNDHFLSQLIRALAPDHAKVAEYVREVRRENPELDTEHLAEYLADRIVWTYSSQGAALALPGAVPGLGTVVQVSVEVGAAGGDIALMVRNQTYLVFALAECYGIRGREVLIQDALVCMGLWTNALALTKSGAIRIGTKIAEASFKKKFPAEVLKSINRKVGTTILTKYGTRRGGVALGKLIPFGVGVLVGGGFNYLTMKNFSSAARSYFALKAPGVIAQND